MNKMFFSSEMFPAFFHRRIIRFSLLSVLFIFIVIYLFKQHKGQEADYIVHTHK